MTFPSRRSFLYFFAALGAVILLAAAAGLLLVQSGWFYEQVRSRIVYEVERATGGRLDLDAFDFNWRTMRATVTGLTLHGKEPASEAPLFHADSVVVGIKVVSALKRDVDLSSLEIDGPRINILVAADGTTNLPKPRISRKSDKNPVERVISLAIGRIELRRGTIRYDTQQLPLEVSGKDLAASLEYDSIHTTYNGRVTVSPVHLRTKWIEPFDLQHLDASVVVEGNRLLVPTAKLETAQSSFVASGTVTGYKRPVALFQVKGQTALAELGPIVRSPLRNEGTASFDGTVSLGVGVPIDIQGAVQGQGIGYDYKGWTLRNAWAKAKLHFTRPLLELTAVEVDALDGAFRGSARLEDLKRFTVKGAAQGFSLERLSQGRLGKHPAWSGRVSGPLEIRGVINGRRLLDAVVATRLSIQPAGTATPLSGEIDLNYGRREGRLKFGSSWLRTPSTRVSFEGTLGDRLHLNLISTNLNDALPAIAVFSDAPPAHLPIELKQGEARFDGWATGPLDNLTIQGHGSLTKFVYANRLVDSLSGQVEVNKGMLQASGVALTLGSLEASLEARVGLQSWKVGESSSLAGRIVLRQADLSTLLAAGNSRLPVTGLISAAIRVGGTVGAPKGISRLAVQDLKLWGQSFDKGTAIIAIESDTLRIVSASLNAGPAKVTLAGRYRRETADWKSGVIDATVAAAAFPLERVESGRQQLAAVDGIIDLNGSATVHVQSGNVRLTAVNGHAALRNLLYRKMALGAITMNAVTEGRAVKIAADGKLRETALHGAGTFDLRDNYPGKGRLTLERLEFRDLEPFLASAFPSGLPFRGFLQADASFEGAVLSPEGLRAQVRVDKFELRPKEPERSTAPAAIETPAGLALRNAKPVVLSLTSKGIVIDNAEFVARDTDFFASGAIAWQNRNPWDLKLNGRIDLAILNSFKPDLASSGRATVDAAVRGALTRPQISGKMELADASFYLRGLPNGIDKANGTILFDRNRANLDNLTAQTGGGEIKLGGFLGFGGPELVYRLQASLANVRVRYPEGVSTTLDSNLNLTGTSSRSLLTGTVTVIRSGFTPRTDLGSLLAQAGKPAPSAVSPNEFLQGLQFDVSIETAPNVQFQTSLTRDLQMEANLRLRGSPAKPVLLGTVDVNQGEIQFFGTKYTISRGEVSFFNAGKIEPVLNMDVETRVRAIIVNINFAGSIDKLNVTYRSDPPLQSSEIIALLTVGRSPVSNDPNVASDQQLQRGNQNLFQSGANGLLGQALAAGVSSRLQRFFGVSRLKIDPQLTGVDNTPQARLTLEQQISKEVTLTYVTNLTRTQQQLVRLEWNLTGDFSVVAIRDENGVFGIDFQYRKRLK